MMLQGAARNLLPYCDPEQNVRVRAGRWTRRRGARTCPAPRRDARRRRAGRPRPRPAGRAPPGHLQLAAVAVAMAPRPGLLLADEPTSQLDHAARDRCCGDRPAPTGSSAPPCCWSPTTPTCGPPAAHGHHPGREDRRRGAAAARSTPWSPPTASSRCRPHALRGPAAGHAGPRPARPEGVLLDVEVPEETAREARRDRCGSTASRCRYGELVAVRDGSTFVVPPGSDARGHRAVRRRQVVAALGAGRRHARTPAPSSSARAVADRPEAAAARASRSSRRATGSRPSLTAAENVLMPLLAAGVPAARRSRGPRPRWPWSVWRSPATTWSRSSPAVSSSGSRWRARSPRRPRWCWPTSRPATSTPPTGERVVEALRAEADARRGRA